MRIVISFVIALLVLPYVLRSLVLGVYMLYFFLCSSVEEENRRQVYERIVAPINAVLFLLCCANWADVLMGIYYRIRIWIEARKGNV